MNNRRWAQGKNKVKIGPSQGRRKARIIKRERWIEVLKSGENPFTPLVLNALRGE